MNKDMNEDIDIDSLSKTIIYRSDIDGLRSIAVISVIIYHSFPNYLPGGFIGVDIFFVISGYLISSIISNKLDINSFNFIHFYINRIKRIFPSLIIVLIICYGIGWYLLLPMDFKDLGIHILGGSGFFSNILLSKESGYFDQTSEIKPLVHLWSLGIEEQFYIIWPILLYLSRKLKLNLIILTMILLICSFTLNIIKVKTNKNEIFYWPTSRIWELLIGAQISFISKYMNEYFQNIIRRLESNDILCIIIMISGVLLIMLPMYFLTKLSLFPGWWALSPTIGTAFLISLGEKSWINKNILSSRFLVGIGLISYPLYLWHFPLIVFMRIYVEDNSSISTHIIIIILCIIFSYITYIFIEKPFRFGEISRGKVTFLCSSMLMIGCIGYYTYRYDGLSYRLPRLIKNLTYYGNGYSYRDVSAYGPTECFLNSKLGQTKFGECVSNTEKPVSTTTVMICGDSHAAHLRPGINATKSDFRIIQLTATECPPIYGISLANIPTCKQIADNIFNRISNEKPNTVVLAASWPSYHWEDLIKTIEFLRNTSVKNIYLVGPVPIWSNGLPRNIYSYYLRDRLHRIPTRMRYGVNPMVEYLDKMMERFAINMKINYISPYKILCNLDGCLTKTGESIDTLTSFDGAHLTITGSVYVVSQFPKNLLHIQ